MSGWEGPSEFCLSSRTCRSRGSRRSSSAGGGRPDGPDAVAGQAWTASRSRLRGCWRPSPPCAGGGRSDAARSRSRSAASELRRRSCSSRRALARSRLCSET